VRPLFLLALLLTPVCLVYSQEADPASARAGSITATIPIPALGSYGAGGLAEFKTPGKPVTVSVELGNSGSAAVRGTVRLQVIDQWTSEPATPIAFTLPAHGHADVAFRVQFGSGTFNAHYPIHAFVEFEETGRKLVAHPILIIQPQRPNPPLAESPVEWKPFQVSANGSLALWRLPIHREHVRVEQNSGPGTPPGVSYETKPTVNFRAREIRVQELEAISMALGPRAPSLRERVSWAATEFPLQLPASGSIRLKFSTTASGGVSRETAAATARVRVTPILKGAMEANSAAIPSQAVFETKPALEAWKEASVDLSRFAGKAVRLQFEASTTDASQSGGVNWGEPVLLTGQVLLAAPFPPAAGAKAKVLGTLNGDRNGGEVRLWPGKRGILDATIGLGGLLFHGLRARVLDDALEDPRSTSELVNVTDESANGAYRLRHQFRSWAGRFDLLAELRVESKALRCRVWLENEPAAKPWLKVYLQQVALGAWNEKASRVYGGVGNVFEEPQAFTMGFDGHNLASSYVGFEFPAGSVVEAVDTPPDRLSVDPVKRIYALDVPHAQTLTLIPAANVWEGVKIWRELDTRKASAGVPQLAGRFVFDIWEGRYSESAELLKKAFQYGLTNSVVVWHNWQRWGYDYRLPDVYPPNPQYGTLDEFRQLVDVCKQNGVLFAPHDNYIDLYPDAEGFTYKSVVFTAEGQPQKAWFHHARMAQSYRARPDQLRPLIERNLKLIRDGFAPTAYFIDVWSSIAPYDYWTDTGEFVDRTVTRRAWGEDFAWIRDYLGNHAPQISEAGHDQLIGWLDGAQANHLRVDPDASGFTLHVKAAAAERIPWLDAAYHERFILHGAGYPDRYAAGLAPATHGIYSDDYIATEVLTGHPAMVSQPFSRDVVRKYWLLDDLMRTLAGRRIQSVEFVDGNIHRQHVRWEGGGEVWVNRGEADWTVADNHRLPPYGFYASVPDSNGAEHMAAIERDGASAGDGNGVKEWSKRTAELYMNPRGRAVGYRWRVGRGSVLITPLPESEPGVLLLPLNANSEWSQIKQVVALGAAGQVLKTINVERGHGQLFFQHERGVFAYRVDSTLGKK
jgi:hypothetical protein